MKDSEEWEREVRFRLRKLLCSIKSWSGINLSQAQNIMAGYADADDLLSYMVEKKCLFKSGERYEFTFDGELDLYRSFIPELQDKYGDTPTEREIMMFVISESDKIAGPKPK